MAVAETAATRNTGYIGQDLDQLTLSYRTPALLAFQNFALLVTAGLITLSAVRVYYFSGFNMPVALGILSVADRANILVSTLLNSLINFIPLAVVAAPARFWNPVKKVPGIRYPVPVGIFLVPLAPLVILNIPLYLLLGFFVGAVIATARALKRRKDVFRPLKGVSQDKDYLRTTLACLAGTLLVTTLLQPWQPLEQVAYKSSESPTVGYVIGEQADLVLVVRKSGGPVWIGKDDIEMREICKTDFDATFWVNPSLSSVINSHSGANCSH